MIVGSTNQLPIAFEEGCRDQTTRLEGMVLTLCISNRDLILLKSYLRPHPYLQISVVGNSS
jgi:hypothetical protein